LEFRKNNFEYYYGDSFGTLGGLGYDHTWSANSFTQRWTQRFAMTITQIAACAWQAHGRRASPQGPVSRAARLGAHAAAQQEG